MKLDRMGRLIINQSLITIVNDTCSANLVDLSADHFQNHEQHPFMKFLGLVTAKTSLLMAKNKEGLCAFDVKLTFHFSILCFYSFSFRLFILYGDLKMF